MIKNVLGLLKIFCVIIAVGIVISSCATQPLDQAKTAYDWTIYKPNISGKTVIINGNHNFGLSVTPEWNWGDGSVIWEHPFPNKHTYKEPGTYTITVKAIIPHEMGFGGFLESSKKVTVTVE